MSRNYSLMFAVFLFILILTPAGMMGQVHAESALHEWDVVAENQYLKLYLDRPSMNLAVEIKETGKVWYTNPANLEDREIIARGTARDRLQSQFTIRYDDPLSRGGQLGRPTTRTRNSYEDSVKYAQVELIDIDQGIRANYFVNPEWEERDYLPRLISGERLRKYILDEISEKDREFILDNYKPVMLVESTGERVEIPGLDKERIFGSYTVLPLEDNYLEDLRRLEELERQAENESDEEIENLRGRLSNVKRDYIRELIDIIVDNSKDLESSDQIRKEQMLPFYETPTYIYQQPFRMIEDEILELIISETAYTPEKKQVDHQYYNIDPPRPNPDVFVIPVEYILDGENLIVRVQTDKIQYPDQVFFPEVGQEGRHVSKPILTLRLLEFFGAADLDQEGFMFVPDGSGALIDLNNGKTDYPGYSRPIYGRDLTYPREVKDRVEKQIYMPVFGIKIENHGAFIGIIENGDAMARIRADIAGKTNSFNTVFAEFTTINSGEIFFSGGAGRQKIYKPRIFEDDIQIRYAFLPDERAGYVDMARFFQKYLEEQGTLEPLTDEMTDMLFYMELVGALLRDRMYMGIPGKTVETMTTFTQAKTIAEELLEADIRNIRLRYSGWLQGGVDHYYPKNANFEQNLGNIEQLKELIEFSDENGMAVYPGVSFLRVHESRFWDGFSPRRDVVRHLDRTLGRAFHYNPATHGIQRDTYSYLFSPSQLDTFVDSFLENYRQYGFSGIALQNMGEDIFSDFNEERLIDRQQSRNILQNQVQKIGEDFHILVDGGNMPVLGHITDVVNIPFQSTEDDLIDRSIPFMQIVLRGYIHYAGEPVNFSPDPELHRLKTVETGANLYYKWFYRESSAIKDTDFDHLYSMDYRHWFDEAVNFYMEANSVLEHVQNQRIIEHQKLQDRVYKTTFENDRAVIVNYNDTRINIGDITLPGKDFVLIESGQ